VTSKKSVLVYSVAAQKLFEAAIANRCLHLGRAIQLTIKDYSGELRKNGQDEVDHSVALTWSLWERGIRRDEDLAKAMLHDLVESNKETLEYIREWFNGEIADDVSRLTRRPEENGRVDDNILEQAFSRIGRYYHDMKTDWLFRKNLSERRLEVLEMLPDAFKKPLGGYYGRLSESAICVVIKNFDKIDIFKNMAYSLRVRNQKLQIVEYEAFLAAACKKIRKTNRKYLEVLFSGRNEIESYVDNLIYQIKLVDKIASEQKRAREKNRQIAKLKKRLGIEKNKTG